MIRLFALLLLALPVAAHASAVIQALRGDVRVGGAPVTQDQRIFRGSSVTTGSNAQVVLRFDDGQQVTLNQNTEFRIADFQYSAGSPREDRSVFDLVKGALRVVSGAIGRRNADAFQLRTPQVTIGVRGTDFMVAIVNPAYVTVVEGSIGATNAAGTVVFGAGATGMVADSLTLPVAVSGSAVPSAASTAFAELGSSNLSAAAGLGGAGGPSAGAAPAAGVAATNRQIKTMLIFAAIAVGVAAIIAQNDNKAAPQH